MGRDHVLWEDDYPHQVSDCPNSQKNIDFSLTRVTDPEVRYKILARNAVKVFNLGN